MPKFQRFTVGFEPPAMNAINDVIASTNYKTVPDVVRAAISVFVDLLDVEDRNLEIVLRDGTGAEWKYSPHKPGRATPVQPASNHEAIIIRPMFGGSVRAVQNGKPVLQAVRDTKEPDEIVNVVSEPPKKKAARLRR